MVNIFELFGDRSMLRVLQYYLERPTEKTYRAQLEKNLKLSKVSIGKALQKLQNAGILEKQAVGRTLLYSLANSNGMVKELKRLLAISKVNEVFKKLQQPNCEIYLYGSAARGENDEKSDLDVLIICDRRGNFFSGLRDEKIKPLLLTRIEYAALARKDKPFYERLEKDRTRIL
ncbi:MAG: nucleotidyltransferase domain-containing protein [Candidatus Micrarchaeota archaeon]